MNGWTAQVRCPHDMVFNVPLRIFWSLDFSWQDGARKSCEGCARDNPPAQPLKTVRQKLETRRVDRRFKSMTRGKRRSPLRWLKDIDKGGTK